MSNITKQEKERNEAVAEAVSKTDLFFSEHKTAIIITVTAIVLICAGIFLYHKYGYQPAAQEAMEQTYPAEELFRNGEYELALNGDGQVLGFAQIIDEYGKKSGVAVYLYAGVCELELGNFEQAAKYLSSYNGKDPILKARAEACLGDAYVGMNDYAKAVKHFETAASTADNMYAATYLLKAGVTYEALENYSKALNAYQTIKDKYPMSVEGYDIDKYISRVETKLAK